MKIELASTVRAFSWAGLLPAVVLRLHAHSAPFVLGPDRVRPAKRRSRSTGHGQRTSPNRANASTEAAPSALGRDGPAAAAAPVDGLRWFEVELFPAAMAEPGARFDDTVALPIDTPRRLDAVIHAASLRLVALPEPHELSHRTIAYRARLKQIVREATRARQRLEDGTYGRCLSCKSAISLALLTERPWRRVCVHCALDI